jgi:hypothetical protein
MFSNRNAETDDNIKAVNNPGTLEAWQGWRDSEGLLQTEILSMKNLRIF